MRNSGVHNWGHALAALLSTTAVGGLCVALLTQAIPRIMARMMQGMMQKMMTQMGQSGCDPVER